MMPARRWRCFRGLLAVLLLAPASGCARGRASGPVTLRLWAMGREGEVVQELVRDFERENPDIRVEVQQMPWSAAHEKLLTAHVGAATPDVAQLGNTWVPEFATLRAIEPLDERVRQSASLAESSYFRGIWDTNVVEGRTYGVPWYVDTRVLFYRTDVLARAGYDSIPGSWAGWRAAMEAVSRVQGPGHYALFLPTNEYTPWIVLGLQARSPMLLDHGTRGAFCGPSSGARSTSRSTSITAQLAPAVPGAQISNRYQEFERGLFSMYISGPWDVGEFQRRLSPSMNGRWFIAPLPGPDGPASGVSTAGGSSLVIFRRSRHQAEAWKLIEFLSRPEQQLRFYRLCGNLPARTEAWRDTLLARDKFARVFEIQLTRVVPTPQVPEWESIALRIQDAAESMVLGHVSPDSALAALDRDVERDLEKRRWLVAHGRIPIQAGEQP